MLVGNIVGLWVGFRKQETHVFVSSVTFLFFSWKMKKLTLEERKANLLKRLTALNEGGAAEDAEE